MRISRVLRTCTCSGGSLGVRVLLEIRNSSGWTCMTVRRKTGPVCSVGLYCTLSKGASVWNCLGESVQAYVLFCHHRWENKTLFRWEENLCPICSTCFFCWSHLEHKIYPVWKCLFDPFGDSVENNPHVYCHLQLPWNHPCCCSLERMKPTSFLANIR